MSTESSDNPAEYDDTLIGTIINKKYIVIYSLGRGSFATVWLVYDMKSKNFYALKMHLYEQNKVANNELELLVKLKKNNYFLNEMVDHFVYKSDDTNDDGKHKEHICIIFPLMAGSMYDLMKKGKYENGFPLNIIKKTVYQLLVAMDALYKVYNVVHTDIKPDNMLVVGTNNKITEIIKQFDKNKFDKLIKKKNKDIDEFVLNYVLNMPCIKEYLDSDSEESSEESNTGSENDSNKSYDDNEPLISDTYMDIKKISIKLSDFGSHLHIDKLHHEIQTLYYRSPEAILMYDINEKCDSWSIGCTLYELLTGEMLFDPHKTDHVSRDRYHLHDMYSILGPIPKEILPKSKKYKYFYLTNGLLKGINKIRYVGLSNLISNKLQNREDIDNTQMNIIIDILYKLLKYDPNERLSFSDCMKHPFFVDYR